MDIISNWCLKNFKVVILDLVNIHWRSPETATDHATSISAVQEFLRHHSEIDAVALIQCTSPFINSVYLQKALSLFQYTNYECVFSVTKLVSYKSYIYLYFFELKNDVL